MAGEVRVSRPYFNTEEINSVKDIDILKTFHSC